MSRGAAHLPAGDRNTLPGVMPASVREGTPEETNPVHNRALLPQGPGYLRVSPGEPARGRENEGCIPKTRPLVLISCYFSDC